LDGQGTKVLSSLPCILHCFSCMLASLPSCRPAAVPPHSPELFVLRPTRPCQLTFELHCFCPLSLLQDAGLPAPNPLMLPFMLVQVRERGRGALAVGVRAGAEVQVFTSAATSPPLLPCSLFTCWQIVTRTLRRRSQPAAVGSFLGSHLHHISCSPLA